CTTIPSRDSSASCPGGSTGSWIPRPAGPPAARRRRWGGGPRRRWTGGASQPVAVMTKAAVTRRLYAMPATRERYFGRIRALLDAAFAQSDILPEIDRMQRLILPFVATADAAGVRAGIDQVRTFVTTRRQVVLAELAAPPAGAPPPPR